ncbi:hypothetical protein MBM_09839 [Drepanopeziza brunnea f. sp. 'multigermtubi' MB_m1]|uniref:Uncharacterized protein n=1 Tax=Marssonina brunnea f. sp. multigermtubi (strain MB_m1) TaxID=1072389 RepID=K1WGH5_MARBU|nr:uncharacterized protein MBM_09839 [Drepanopeziza brunnea f. sp. 'multigermtubi' MB_m1]EKD11976.1 hypothetical protein MBM_09839 [Drepanopeziza brunnea f. sp. 'multigermtubi' MB_m1]
MRSNRKARFLYPPPRFTPFYPERVVNPLGQYQHIKFILSSEPTPPAVTPRTFVGRSSLQEEIDLGIATAHLLPRSASAEILCRPRTFAEAAMTTPPVRRNSGALHDTDISDESALPGRSMLALKRKKKIAKWQPLDLSESNNTDDDTEGGDDATSAVASSALPTRANTPNPKPRVPEYSPPTASASSSFQHTNNTARSISPDNNSTFEVKGNDNVVKEYAEDTSFKHVYSTPVKQESIVPNASGHHLGATAPLYESPGLYTPSHTPTQATFSSSHINPLIDNDPTPRLSQAQFPAPYNHIALSPLDQGTFGGDEEEDPNRSDTQSTKERTAAVLARLTNTAMAGRGKNVVALGEDLFDSVEWDPELPKAPPPTESPEPVTIKPQPVAYTTVGSLVDPNAVTQFSAPNRIQREGANRRQMPLSALQSRALAEGFMQPRGPPPPLNMANSMQYAQQLGRKYTQVGQSSPSSLSSTFSTLLTDHEKEILIRNCQPEAFSSNSEVPSAPFPYDFVVTSRPTDENRKLRDLDDTRARSNSFKGSLQGMDKMHTLYNLSLFENPMQEMARSRLAELSLKSQTIGKTVGNPRGLTPYEVSLQNQRPSTLSAAAESYNGPGELNRGYQFPPPGLVIPQANPLRAALNNSQTDIPQQPQRAGMPQPLTAGPPGQRQFYSGSSQFGAQPSQNTQQSQGASHTPGSLDWGNLKNGGAAASATQVPQNFTQSKGYPSTPVYDTIPREQALQYYPNGFPEGMDSFNDHWGYVSEENQRAMDRSFLDADQLKAIREKEDEDTHYQGQRRYVTMSIDDYIAEYIRHKERQTHSANNPWGNISPPERITQPMIPQEIAIEDALKIPVEDTVGPLLPGVYGSLLAYRETGPGSRARMSGFVTPAPHLIDTSPTGNDTSFGEDWGNPNFRSQDTKPASSRATSGLDALREIGNARSGGRIAGGNGKWYGNQ